MKKVTAFLLICVLVVGFATVVSAYKVGDVINKTVYTDIIASINDYNIASFNIDGYTAVVAEDLRNYGFNVEWKQDERALYITRGSTNKVAATYIAPEIPKSQVGKKATDVVYTDIKTYINGVCVTSFNIGGNTIVYFNDLAAFGNISYNDSRRRLDLDISGLDYKLGYPQLSQFEPSDLYFKKNSANGIQVRWSAINNTNKVINYYTTYYTMYNPVYDLAYDQITKEPYFKLKTVGPAPVGSKILDFTGKYKGVAYSATCEYLYLSKVELEYSDGTKETIYLDKIGKEENGEFVL